MKDKILRAFERADKLKIAFIGETIIDEYRYVKVLGKSSKESILSVVDSDEPAEIFEGGVIAASKHGEFANVEVYTDIGQHVRITRYLDIDSKSKLFVSHSRQQMPSRDFNDVEADIAVILDFGYGLINTKTPGVAFLPKIKFHAVNVQTSAANYGFNLFTKYKSAVDFLCVNIGEARLGLRMQHEHYDMVAKRIGGCAKRTAITMGKLGCVVINSKPPPGVYNLSAHDIKHVPAVAKSSVDTVGAGDSFIAVTAPLIAAGLELEAAALVGNIVAAIKINILGHRRHVTRNEIIEYMEKVLK